MAESILVTGKKISSMELVTNVTGNEKIPTGQPDDLAITPNQIADHTIARGDLASHGDLSQVEVDLTAQIATLAGDVAAEDNSIRGLIAAEEAARIAKDLELQQGLSDETVSRIAADADLVGRVSVISDNLSSTVQTFTSPEAGVDLVTGVADGAYFNVRSTEDDTMLVEYQNVGGVATPSGKSYPSSSYVQLVADQVDYVAEFTALPFVDGKTYGLNDRVQLENGDIVKSTVANNTFDPNADMMGWEFEGLLKSIYNPLNLNYTQQQLATAFTTSLNALIQKVSLSGGGTISIPDGQFPIDVTVGITLLDNIELRFGKNTVLKASAHNSPQHEILRIHDVNNVTISGGGTIDGNKSQNSATTGEWGMGVSIRGADNIHISDLKIKDTWGDGFYIGRTPNRAFSSRVTLDRVGSDAARRNGLSVISVKELDVNDSSFDNSIEKEPKCGIDIEPNYADEFIQGVRFKNLKTTGNNIGLNLYLAPLIGTNSLVTVDIDGWTDRNSRRENFANRNYLPDSSGYISVNGFTAINEEQSNGSMLSLYATAKTGMAFRLKNIVLMSKITDINIPYVRIGRFTTAGSDQTMGNVEIDGITAKTLNTTLPTNAIILSALEGTSKLDGVSIKNIGRLDAVDPIRSAYRVSGLTIKDENRNLYRSLPAGQSTVGTFSLYPLYIRDSAATSTAIISSNLPSGFEFEIRNAVAGSLDVNVSLITLVSNNLGGTGSLRCSTVGGFIKLKSLGGGVVEYISSYGFTQDGATASTAQATVSVPANSQMLLKSVNLTGITTSNPVAVSYSVPAAGLNIWAACEVDGSVNVYAVNHTAAAISLSAGTIRVSRL